MNADIRLIKKFAKSKKKWNLSEVNLLYNIYRTNKFGMQDHSPAQKFPDGTIVLMKTHIDKGIQNLFYKIDYRLPHGPEAYLITPYGHNGQSLYVNAEGLVDAPGPGVKPERLF